MNKSKKIAKNALLENGPMQLHLSRTSNASCAQAVGTPPRRVSILMTSVSCVAKGSFLQRKAKIQTALTTVHQERSATRQDCLRPQNVRSVQVENFQRIWVQYFALASVLLGSFLTKLGLIPKLCALKSARLGSTRTQAASILIACVKNVRLVSSLTKKD